MRMFRSPRAGMLTGVTRRRVRIAVLLLAVPLGACSSRNAAETAIVSTANIIINQVETSPAFHRGQWAEAGVNYLKAGVLQYHGLVLDSKVVDTGMAANDELIGWVDAQFTQTATESGFGGRPPTATLCLRFEVRWQAASDDVLSYHEIDCS